MTIQIIADSQVLPLTEYWMAGLNPIPIRADGSKAAAIPWKEYINRRATEDEINHWQFAFKSFALINGAVSGGQETIDVDDPSCIDSLIERIDPSLSSRLVINNTPRGGGHILYQSSTVCPSKKISLDQNGKVRIESRGEGSYTIAPGSSPLTHPSGKLYSIRRWPNYPHLPVITDEERAHIWQCCLEFDDKARHIEAEHEKLLKSAMERYTSRTPSSKHVLPKLGEAARHELLKAGWSSSDNQSFTRPGKSNGTSGKFNIANDGREIFTVFSTNAGGLSPDDGHKNWSLFDLIQKLRIEKTIS